MRMTFILCVLLGGCGSGPLPVENESDERPTNPTPYAGTESCTGAGSLDFEVRGDGLDAWDGRGVVAVAVQRDTYDQDTLPEHRRVVRSGVIRAGSFHLSCDRGLDPNNFYPSWGVFVDLDGDGHCGPADVGYSEQLYAVLGDLRATIESDLWRPVGDPQLYGPVTWRNSPGFCGGFFEPAADQMR